MIVETVFDRWEGQPPLLSCYLSLFIIPLWPRKTSLFLSALLPAVTCPDVEDILNGDLSVDAAYPEGPLPLHSTVIYSCNDGYEFSDGTKVLTRVCQANGHWSGQHPACEGKKYY